MAKQDEKYGPAMARNESLSIAESHFLEETSQKLRLDCFLVLTQQNRQNRVVPRAKAPLNGIRVKLWLEHTCAFDSRSKIAELGIIAKGIAVRMAAIGVGIAKESFAFVLWVDSQLWQLLRGQCGGRKVRIIPLSQNVTLSNAFDSLRHRESDDAAQAFMKQLASQEGYTTACQYLVLLRCCIIFTLGICARYKFRFLIDVTTNLRRHDSGKSSGLEWLKPRGFAEEPGDSEQHRACRREGESKRERAGS
ncbi:hypothetical protein R3P38DRAFT_2809081 [Favolaschia claudopus]|uniref:Uncharacterized protein n=1 Tax=Favolaschia claudopus TaxID=2862362 RepID=A0AAV9ZE26_9AGAR